jgi:hypothetical protein
VALLRVLHRAVCVASTTPASAVHGPSELRHLRWRLSLSRSTSALRMVQAEVMHLLRNPEPLLNLDERSSSIGSMLGSASKRARRAPADAETLAVTTEGLDEDADLVGAAIAMANASTGAAEDVDASCVAPCTDLIRRRELVWRAVALAPGWAQVAMVHFVRGMASSAAEAAASGPDAAFVLWCACPACPPGDADAAAYAAVESETGLNVGALRQWLLSTASEICTVVKNSIYMPSTGAAPKVAAQDLCSRVVRWQSGSESHPGLLSQMLIAATCVAADPTLWLQATLIALSGSVWDQGMAALNIDWMWHLLSDLLHRDAHSSRGLNMARALAAGATMVIECTTDPDAGTRASLTLLQQAVEKLLKSCSGAP